MGDSCAKVLLYQRIIPPYKLSLISQIAREHDVCVVHAKELSGSEVTDVADPPFDSRRTWRVYVPGRPNIVWLGGVTLPLVMRPKAVIFEGSAGILSNPLLLLVCWLARVPAIAWTFGFDPDTGPSDSRFSDRLRLWSFERAARILVYWHKGDESLSALRPSLSEKIIVAPNVVGDDLVEPLRSELSARGRAEVRESLGLDASDLVVLFLGRLVPVKQCGVLLDALASVVDACGRRVICIIGGDGPERVQLEEQTRMLALSNVTFLGHVAPSDAGTWLFAADVNIVPGRLGLVVSHAAAFGCPTVSIKAEESRHGEGEEHLVEGVTGFWAANGAHIGDLLAEWCVDDRALREVRARAESYYEGHLSSQATVAAFGRAIEEVSCLTNS